ncbi:MAG: DUF6048 family protein [Bacteroidota bacterium]
MSRYLISLLALLWTLTLSAPSWAKANPYRPTGLRLSTDCYRPLYYGYQGTGLQYEFSGSIDFRRLMLEGDYGWGYIQRKGICKQKNIWPSCNNEGKYFRIGLNYNFISKSTDHHAAFLGARYAMSHFQDHLKSTLQDQYWGNYSIDSQQGQLKARWFEVVAGAKVQVWRWIYIGCTVRYKFYKKISNITSHIPFDIIGWGLNDEGAFGLNYYISLRIPLQKSPNKPPIQRKRAHF